MPTLPLPISCVCACVCNRRREGAAGLEDGTAHYLGIAAVSHGFRQLASLGGFPAIACHTQAVTRSAPVQYHQAWNCFVRLQESCAFLLSNQDAFLLSSQDAYDRLLWRQPVYN